MQTIFAQMKLRKERKLEVYKQECGVHVANHFKSISQSNYIIQDVLNKIGDSLHLTKLASLGVLLKQFSAYMSVHACNQRTTGFLVNLKGRRI